MRAKSIISSSLPCRRPAERFFNLMRVINSTSSDYSYAVGGYFVGSMPEWFVVRLGELD
ncbi:hypothetical protein [Enterobacter hormaechei]|uniref:hypothetical protein n=1 Tax=Enterobacter hormaechei TaxID=158836 RepID=UPI00389080C0